jgi:regulator of protease activity HflC (stomatin/prohibitin superfamily)
MENAFMWLRDIADWLGMFVPRRVIVDSTHGWVKFVKGGKIITGGPQIVMFWPVTTNLHTYPTARQAVSLPSQVITTKDGQTVAIGGLLVYDIADLEKILAHTYDPEETIKDIAASSLHDVCCRETWDDLRGGQGRQLDTKLKNEAKKDLDDYGVRVIKFTLTTMALATVTRVIRSTFPEGQSNPT